MSASASKKKRKALDEQGLSPKAVEARTKKEQKGRTLRSALSVVLTIAVLASIVFLVIKYVNRELNKPSYDVNAAVATIGDEKITVPVYNFFYNQVVSQYASQLESGTPLSQQQNGDKTMEETMQENTKQALEEIYNLYIEAKANNHQLSDEEKEDIDASVSSMRDEAANYGYANLNSYLRTRFGEGCDEDSFREYMTVAMTANSYSMKFSEEFATTAEELDAEYNKDPSAYDVVCFTYATSAAESVVVPAAASDRDEESTDSSEDDEGSENTDDANADADATIPTETMYTDAAKAAAQETAEGYLKDMPDSATTTSYNKSIVSMFLPAEAAEWLFDENRKEGDAKVFAASEEETVFYAIRFESRDTNDYKPVNANIISISRNTTANDESEEAEQTPEEKFEALKAAVKEGMSDEEFTAAASALVGFANTQLSSVTKAYPNEQIRDFLFDPARKAGDLTTFETDSNYYVVRFSSLAEKTYRDSLITNTLLSNKYKEITTAKSVEIVDAMMEFAQTDLTVGSASY